MGLHLESDFLQVQFQPGDPIAGFGSLLPGLPGIVFQCIQGRSKFVQARFFRGGLFLGPDHPLLASFEGLRDFLPSRRYFSQFLAEAGQILFLGGGFHLEVLEPAGGL